MGGFLSGLLTAVAIVATVATGGALGIVAGAMIAMSYASSKGWIGGSVGKFFNSSTGHYLTMAVGLASAAGAIMSSTGAVATTSQSSTVASANAAAEGGAASAGAAGGAAGGAADMASGSAALQAGSDALTAAPTVSSTAAQTMSNGEFTAVANSYNAGAGTTLGGLSNSSMAASDLEAQQVSRLTGIPAAPAVSGNVTTGATDAATSEAQAGQTAGTNLSNAQKAVNPADTTNTSVSANPNQDLNPVDTSQAVGQAKVNAAAGARNEADIAAGGQGSGSGGFLSKASDVLEHHAGLATVAGNALSGMAQGASQQKMMQEQIAAQQWGNMQWQDPTQVAKLNAAAAQPINVPVGYLNRAAAVRNLMNGSTNQSTPLSGPATPAAPPPTVKPVGM